MIVIPRSLFKSNSVAFLKSSSISTSSSLRKTSKFTFTNRNTTINKCLFAKRTFSDANRRKEDEKNIKSTPLDSSNILSVESMKKKVYVRGYGNAGLEITTREGQGSYTGKTVLQRSNNICII